MALRALIFDFDGMIDRGIDSLRGVTVQAAGGWLAAPRSP